MHLTRPVPYMARKSWFSMAPVAKAGDGKKILNVEIFGEIGWDVNAATFSRELREAGQVDEISLSIHSPGGSVVEGWAVANILLNHAATVRGRVEGIAASMGSVILAACDIREIPANAYVMIHNVSGGEWGSSDEMRRMADLIDKLTDDIANFFVARTGQSLEQVKAWMDDETWMNGAEAVERGFATVLLPSVEAAALVDGIDSMDRRFSNLPEVLNISDEPAGDEPAGDEPAGDEPAGDEPAGDEPAGDEPAGDEPAGDEPAGDEPAAPTGHKKRLSIIAQLKGFLPGGKSTGDDKALTENLATLRAQLNTEREAREAAVNRAQALERENQRMQREARDLDAALEEMGLSAADASDLPAKSTEDEVLSIREQFNQMPKGPERTAFFKQHKAELEK